MTTRNKSSGNAEFEYYVQVILNNDKIIKAGLHAAKVRGKDKLLDFCKDSGKINALKWKDSQTQSEIGFDEDQIKELEALPSFVNYLQNDHGRKLRHPIDITQWTRESFKLFLELDDDEGGGKVKYDPVKALESEQRNFPPTTSSGNTTTTTPPVINATSAKPSALDALNKKLVLKKELCPVLTSKLGWKQWKTRLTAQCKLCDNENPLDANYQVPAGDEDLDKKQCILLYTIFQTNVTSVEGTAIVDKHANTMDGRACFADLVKEHKGNISAKNQARKLKKRLNLVQVPVTLKKPLFSYLTDHENWVRGYNSYCHPSKVMDDDDRLDSLENYLALVPGIDSVRRQMDITDIHGTSRNLSAAERIEYYYDFARDQDDHTKEDQTTPRRRANISELSINVAGMTFCGMEESFDPSDFEEVDSSMSVVEYEVNAAAAGQQRRFGFIHPDDYKSMDPESRRKFLSIPAKDREIIITSESSRAATSSKPSPPTTGARPGLKTGVTNKNARVNIADTSSHDNNGEPLLPVQEEDAPAQIEAKMSISRCIAQGPIEVNSARSTLPPAIATRVFGSNLQQHDCRDTRRMMSDQNTIELPRRPIAPSSTPRQSSTPVTASSARSHHPLPQPPVTFPDILGGSTRRSAFATEGNYGPTMVEVDAAVTDDVTALGEVMHADVDDTVVIAASALMLGIAGLIDGGANGGLASPTEMRRIRYAEPSRKLNIKGVGDHNIEGLPIGTYAAKVRAADGWILAIFPEYGELINGGTTIHSAVQLRDGGCRVDDVPKAQGGAQLLQTKEGFVIPLDVENGLVYMKMHYPSDEDLNDPALPHVVMTRDVPWDPCRYDSRQSDVDAVHEQLAADHPRENVHPNFNDFGEYLLTNCLDTVPTVPIWDISRSEAVNVSGEDPVYHLGEHLWMDLRVPTTGELLENPDILYYCLHDDHVGPTLTSELYAFSATLSDHNFTDVYYGEQTLQPIEYEAHRKYFLNVPASTVCHTFDCTTRYYRHIPATNHFMTFRSPYPALNVFRRRELVASDTVYADIVAWGGITAAQVFVGKLSRYVSVYGCKSDAEFVKTLEDEIRKRGAMDKLVTDRAAAEISNKVKDILRTLFIDDWQSEPYFHHQLFVERIIQELKKFANRVLDWSQAPEEAWFLVFEYVSFIMNRTAKEGLDWRTPVEALTGNTPDISILLHFTFWEPVFIANYQGSGKEFPSEWNEILVRFVGFAEGIGHSITFKVFNEATQQVLYRSCLRKVDKELDVSAPPYDPKDLNDPDDEAIPQVIKLSGDDNIRRSPTISPDELIGRHFLMETREDGQCFRAQILDYEVVDDPMNKFQSDLEREPERIKFRVKVGGQDGLEEYVEWSQMCEFIQEQVEQEDHTWRFRRIAGHKKDLKAREVPQVLIQWESGEITFEPITEIYDADPYLLAEYARDNGLLDEWEMRVKRLKLKQHAKNAKKLMRMINQAKLRAFREGPIYMYGERVPRNHAEAMQFDRENGNTKWADAEKLEKSQLFEYNCFEDRGHRSNATVPKGYKKIRVHMVYAVKHDGRYKARCVAGGHLCDPPNKSVYAGVVSLRGIRFVLFIAELNGLEVYQTDVGNAYLEAKTNEKVYIIAGGEFGEYHDHVLIIVGALYGLPTSGKRWYERFSDVLRGMGFHPCPAEPEIWMRACNPDGSVMSEADLASEDPSFTYDGVSRPVFEGYYEYIATYCDDLTIASKDPMAIADYLTDVEKFKLKGTAPLNFLLGCDYFRDDDGTLCSQPKKYIEKMESTYERLFGEKPKHRYHPLEPNDHPELDTTDLLDSEGTRLYQSLIGSAQWIISLGRFDLAVHIMTLSSFRVAPRKGHLERIKRVYGYLSKFKHGIIRYRTGLPDYSDLEFIQYDWSRTVYAGACEEYPPNLPAARGKAVQTSTYVDANLYHDMLTGKAVTGILHYLNQTPIDWFSKKQSTVETATFGSESSAARTAIEQIRSNKLTLLYLGVPLIDRSILVGDNKTVVESMTMPHSKLHKRHLMLSYHFVREAIASGNYVFSWLDGKLNPADVLSKHWGYQVVWPLLQPILFWKGDTAKLFEEEESKSQRG